jgi:tetratricopeptide (TPR) repeat protein
MEPKDVVNLLVSTVALLLSGVATTVSISRGKREEERAQREEERGKREEERTIRNQLSDILSKINSTNIENAKFFREAGTQDPGWFQAVSSALNQQQAFLLDEGMYLADRIPRLVSAVEYNTLALAHANFGNMVNADKLFKRAIEVSRDNYYRSLATRSYAFFLFSQRRFEEGRKSYQDALSLITASDNYSRYTNGYTYQQWAANERIWANAPQRAEELFASARNEFNGIDAEAIRDQALQGLEQVKASGGPRVPSQGPSLTSHGAGSKDFLRSTPPGGENLTGRTAAQT